MPTSQYWIAGDFHIFDRSLLIPPQRNSSSYPKKLYVAYKLKIVNHLVLYTLRELIFTNFAKISAPKIIGDCATREIREN